MQCENHVCNRICHGGSCFDETTVPAKKKKKNKKKEKQAQQEQKEEEEKPQEEGFDGMQTTPFGASLTSILDDIKAPPPTCGRLCGAKLSTCEHLCQAICHPGRNCPVILCKQMVYSFTLQDL